MIITSYFTIDTPYEQVVNQYLRPSLEKLNLKHLIKGIRSFGSWQLNTAYKPKFILEMFDMFPGEDIVFIDCDAAVEQNPTLFNQIPEQYNIACHVLDRQQWYGREYSDTDRYELLSGTIFFRNNNATKLIIRDWWNRAQLTNIWEQKVLQKVIETNSIPIYQIPLSYIWIDSLPDGRKPVVPEPNEGVVIRHYQKSREFKNKLK